MYQFSFGYKRKSRNCVSLREIVLEVCCFSFVKVPFLYLIGGIFSCLKKNKKTTKPFLLMGNNKQNAHIHLRVASLIARNSASYLFFCFVCSVCWEIDQATSSLLSWPCKTRSSTWFLITVPWSSIVYACYSSFKDWGSSQGSRLIRDCQLTFLW